MPPAENMRGKQQTTTNGTVVPKRPTTLKEAHELMMRLRPRHDAPLTVWREYREQSAALYAQIADMDRFHHHEARYWAELEGEIARNLAAQIDAAKSR